jgi:hypothetical protein
MHVSRYPAQIYSSNKTRFAYVHVYPEGRVKLYIDNLHHWASGGSLTMM